jgi:hypothetical protein
MGFDLKGSVRKARSLCGVLILALAGAAYAVELGQVDDFESGGTRGWQGDAGANPNPPTVIADGGPLGAGDGFLRIQGNGGLGPGSKPTASNTVTWTGNYTGSGVTRISADLKNAGTNAVHLRFQLFSLAAFSIKYYVTPAITLAAGSGWVHVSWPVDAASLIPVDPVPGDPAQGLTGVAELSIFHAPAAVRSNDAPAIVAEYGIDNIRAETTLTDRDSDGWPDTLDNCPFLANAVQHDFDENGRGNACECGDQNGDGTVDVLDLLAINFAIFNPSLRTPLCDANNDDDCNVIDIVAANLEIFSAGPTSTCAVQPEAGP